MKRIALSALLAATLMAVPAAFTQQDEEQPLRYVGRFTLDEVLEHDERYADAAFLFIPDADALEVFRGVEHPVTIKMFYRTDCIDSVREVPRFIRTIQLADNDNIQVDAIGLERGSAEPAELVAGWDIQRVPTFIVVIDGEEVGRVIETARESIEIDLAKFLRPSEQ